MEHVSSGGSVISVNLPARKTHYPIELGSGSLSSIGERIQALLPKAKKVLVITDPNVAPLYLEGVLNALQAAGLKSFAHITPVFGENAKALAGVQAIYHQCQQSGLSRQDIILALGGGVIGDLAGFCAATFYRGVQFVQVPTTLLAQVDSSVGGKVAVNFGNSKNGVGSFYQPALVIIDPNTLNTLPERELKAGLAEVLKYALLEQSIPKMFHSALGDKSDEAPPFLEFLENLLALPSDWIPLIEACCQMKAAVVAADETETLGIRAILNLGHTFAHAYEEASGYQMFLHGEAVALGIRHACWLSQALGLLDKPEVHRAEALASAMGLMQGFPNGFRPDAAVLLDLMRHDKKAARGKITLVLPCMPLGNVVLRDNVLEIEILSVLNRALIGQNAAAKD